MHCTAMQELKKTNNWSLWDARFTFLLLGRAKYQAADSCSDPQRILCATQGEGIATTETPCDQHAFAYQCLRMHVSITVRVVHAIPNAYARVVDTSFRDERKLCVMCFCVGVVQMRSSAVSARGNIRSNGDRPGCGHVFWCGQG